MRLRFCGRGRIAIVRVADEPVFEAQRVNGLRQIRRERHDAVSLVREFSTRRPTSSVTMRPPEDCASLLPERAGCGNSHIAPAVATSAHQNSRDEVCQPRTRPNSVSQTKKPREDSEALATPFLAKSAASTGRQFLTFGAHACSAPITVAGPWPIFTAFRCPSQFNCRCECMLRSTWCQLVGSALAVLPFRRALLHQRAQTFLRIFELRQVRSRKPSSSCEPHRARAIPGCR